ncbi:MAG TPA: DEAD/DEAH box helicase [Lacipirellulaceae bacterium]|nr:DEAD/DEAH box helicase [Lacipirellulaceae bacterium]
MNADRPRKTETRRMRGGTLFKMWQSELTNDGSHSRDLDSLSIAPPVCGPILLSLAPAGVVSWQLNNPRLRTIGCVFERGARSKNREVGGAEPGIGRLKRNNNEEQSRCSLLPAPRNTRVRPPRDLVKLEDRLRLLLEPPLETLLTSRGLRFPFPPFGYQLDGVAFLYPRPEAVLADEMGLGKTMQAVTAIRLLAHQGQLRRILLVCPKPLVTNWQREFAIWAPELPIAVVEGGPDRRQFFWREASQLVTITNYEALVRDRAQVCIPDNHYDLVLLDESQRIKNIASTTNEVVRAIPRSRSWALTGTPIENSTDDLVGIFEFVAPGLVNGQVKPKAIGRAVADHVLRRTKDQVLSDLPPKLFREAELDLSPEQTESYRLAEDEGVVRLRNLKHELTIQHVFELVLRLKQICNFDPTTGASSKLERLEADLAECALSRRKAIVFSQWVATLTELRSRLARFGPAEYHGQISQARREATIERFRDDPNCHVMLMTYGAGGVGLNLQFASYVFLFDRWWNPAVEDQAINRAHRIGSQRAVTVTRFLTANTIEQRINQVLEQKRALFDAVFNETTAPTNGGLSRDEIFSLFDLRMPANTGKAA